MSAQVLYETRTAERPICYIDSLGYAYCVTCFPNIARPAERCAPDGNCDECGKDLRQSVELVDGTAAIEYTPARIF